MLWTVALVFSCICAPSISSPPSVTKVYRSDYEYNEKTNAFYKLHTDTGMRVYAGQHCQLEGASLMVPSSPLDIVQLHSMFKRFPDLGEHVYVAEDDRAHESAEEPVMIDLMPRTGEYFGRGRSECDVMNRKGEIESLPCYHRLPYICKVAAHDAYYNKECGVYGKGYKLFPGVKSCYKIPDMPATWNQAYAECRAEGAHLVVINSEAEHDAVHEYISSVPAVPGSHAWWFLYAGYRAAARADATTPKVFKTIFNETLEEAGYSTWAPNEPNNAMNNEDCGTLFKNDGKLNDVSCTELYGFICEKETS